MSGLKLATALERARAERDEARAARDAYRVHRDQMEAQRDKALAERDAALAQAAEVREGARQVRSISAWVSGSLNRCRKARDRAEAERDEAQEACRAWQGVYETLEAHLMDRVAMRDDASPETYLDLLRSSVARVERDSAQVLAGRRAQYAEVSRQRDRVEAERDELRDALESIARWSDAYPLSVFPEPDHEKAARVLKAAGMTLDAVAASGMRYVVEGVGRIAKEALAKVGDEL